MFVDDVTVAVAAGRGGSGAASFRREKFVPQGGPDGGDGGRGGDVLVVADPHLTSLQAYLTAHQVHAGDGRPGAGAHKHGAAGDERRLAVPVGTVVTDGVTGAGLGDLAHPGAAVVVARGGRGGRGNAAFASAVQRAPRLRELGEPGEARSVRLELRVIADIGLVGLPNSGKSTLLAAWTGAHPRIADYPFTTLSPNLGVAEAPDGRPVVVADVPGLIEGAHLGAGLGIAFLRHLVRTRVLVHLVDATQPAPVVLRSIRAVAAELAAHSPELAAKPRLLALNKVDAVEPRQLRSLQRSLERARVDPDLAHAVSALTGAGADRLLAAAAAAVSGAVDAPAATTGPSLLGPAASARSRRELRRESTRGRDPTFRLYQGPPARGTVGDVLRTTQGFVVRDPTLVRLTAMTDLDDPEGTLRLQQRFRRAGLEAELRRLGAAAGDQVLIGEHAFTYVPDGPAAPAG
ncbi:MAG TPA: GTPase ObgE [Verrucomicrobiae bacterium]|nr:GTPase ObgE [Verrucomicrobiae bacterium]